MLHLAAVVPRTAHFLPAPDVNHSKSATAVQPAQPSRRKGRIQGIAVGSVAVDQKRNGSGCSCRTDHGNGNLRSVRGRSPKPVSFVRLRCVSAHHLLHFADAALSGSHVVIKDLAGLHQRGVTHAQPIGLVFGVGPHVSGVGGILERHLVLGHGRIPGFYDDPRQSVEAFFQNQVVGKQLHAFQKDVGPVRNDYFPVFQGCLDFGALHQLEILRAMGIGADVPPVLVVSSTILQLGLAGLETSPLAQRLISGQDVHLVGSAATRGNRQEFLALGPVHGAGKCLVQFVKKHVGQGSGGTQVQPPNPVHTQGLVVFGGIKKIIAAGRPRGRTGCAFGYQNGRRLLAQPHPKQVISTSAHKVHAIDHFLVIRREKQPTDLAVGMPFCQYIDIQEQFLLTNGVTRLVALSAVQRVLLPLLVAGIVPIALPQNGNAFVHLRNPTDHFLVQGLLQSVNRFHAGFPVGVFGF